MQEGHKEYAPALDNFQLILLENYFGDNKFRRGIKFHSKCSCCSTFSYVTKHTAYETSLHSVNALDFYLGVLSLNFGWDICCPN